MGAVASLPRPAPLPIRPLALFLCKVCRGGAPERGKPECSACDGKGLVLR